MHSRFTPTCFSKSLPSSGCRSYLRSYSSNICIVDVRVYGLRSVQCCQLSRDATLACNKLLWVSPVTHNVSAIGLPSRYFSVVWQQPRSYLQTIHSPRQQSGVVVEAFATNRKVAGSNPDGVIGVFHWHKSSGRTMALRSTQPLTEMSSRDISWG
jgi:hypothetical protein